MEQQQHHQHPYASAGHFFPGGQSSSSSSYGVSGSGAAAHAQVVTYSQEHLLSHLAKNAAYQQAQDGKAAPSYSRSTLADVTNNSQQALSQRNSTASQKPGADRKPLASVSQASVGSRGQPAAAKLAGNSFAPSIPHGAFIDPRVIDGVHHHHEHAATVDNHSLSAATAATAAAALERRRITRDWIDVDALNHDDPQACSHYAQSIFEHLREAELLRRPDANYLAMQPEINAKMRSILVDWLVEVSEEYKLCADTLYLAIGYLDRLLTVHRVPRAQLQLVGITCMWIAAKYEEIYPPNVSEFTYITDNTYSKEQLVAMEEEVLKKLKYELTVPTAKTFLRRMLQVCNPDDQLHFVANYLTEISLMDHCMMNFLPSEVSAASVYLANLLLSRPPWSATLEHYSFYSPHQIADCIEALAQLHVQVHTRAISGELTALHDKYAHSKYLCVSRNSPLPVHAVSQHIALVLSNAAAVSGVSSRA